MDVSVSDPRAGLGGEAAEIEKPVGNRGMDRIVE